MGADENQRKALLDAMPDLARETVEEEFLEIYARCRPYTMTSWERMYALYQSVNHIVALDIPGDIVECGVWKGGSCMLTAMTLIAREGEHTSRRIFLYDTFTGMAQPGTNDVSRYDEKTALEQWQEARHENYIDWCYSPLREVKMNMALTGYLENRLVFVSGRVEETLPSIRPETIALLRLDTDWYESTYHEMVHLYPLLSKKGILIIDDYGYWTGAREAVNRYFAEQDVFSMLQRIDQTGRLHLKLTR